MTAAATSKMRHQRCLDAISGKPVDRPPKYLPAIACEVSSRILGRPVHTGTGSLRYAEVLAWAKGDSAHADFEAQFLQDIVEIHHVLGVDVFRMPWRMNVRPSRQLDEFTFVIGDPNGDHSIWRYNPESADFGLVREVCSSPPQENWLERWVEEQEANLRAGSSSSMGVQPEHVGLCRRFGKEFFVACNGGVVSVGLAEKDLTSLALAPDLMRRKLMIQVRWAVHLGESLSRSGCPKVMLGGGDMAGNQGPVYSPKSFREVVLPAYRDLLQHLSRMRIHYVFRSDGNLWPIADMLFGEAECPGYGEADRDAGMTVARLRQRFPRLVVWGNVSSTFLARATTQQVRDESRRIIEESGGTGYFHGCSNAIVKGTPPQNVEAMFSID